MLSFYRLASRIRLSQIGPLLVLVIVLRPWMPDWLQNHAEAAIQLLFTGVLIVLLTRLQRMEVHITSTAARTNRNFEAVLTLHDLVPPGAVLPKFNDWTISPDLAQTLVHLVMTRKPDTVVELGSGLSTVVMALCLRRLGRGRLFSLEHDAAWLAHTQQAVNELGLQDQVTLLHCPLVPTSLPDWSGQWYKTDDLPIVSPIDLLLVDGPPGTTGHQARYPAFTVLASRLAPGGEVVLDDADRPHELAIVDRLQTAGWHSMDLEVERGGRLLRRL